MPDRPIALTGAAGEHYVAFKLSALEPAAANGGRMIRALCRRGSAPMRLALKS